MLGFPLNEAIMIIGVILVAVFMLLLEVSDDIVLLIEISEYSYIHIYIYIYIYIYLFKKSIPAADNTIFDLTNKNTKLLKNRLTLTEVYI